MKIEGSTIAWNLDLTQEQQIELKSLWSKPPLHEVVLVYKKFVRGKQYARPFTYLLQESLGTGGLTHEINTNDESILDYSITLNGIGDLDINS